MPWFLTLFASKTPLAIAVELWDRHLERDEPPFFIFLAVAVLGNAEKQILASERSALPEILTSLRVSSSQELESVWLAAEDPYARTPATFVERLRKNVLRPVQPRAEEGSDVADSAAERLLQRLEQEKYFFILEEEVVGHCYPPRAGEKRKAWQPLPTCPWRLQVLDVRPPDHFKAGHLPAALHFDPLQATPPAQRPWAAGKRLLGMSQSDSLDAFRVFEALKAVLGEDMVCDSRAHICLMGSVEDAALIKSLYVVLTLQLALRHVSVASGGYEAAAACAKRHGYDIVAEQKAEVERTAKAEIERTA